MTDQDSLFDPAPYDATPAQATGDAYLSADGQYRYWLSRRWADVGPSATFIMINPSTADATADDRTIGRCISFAKEWGCALLRVVNLYALISTDPDGLWAHDDPVGPEADYWLEHALSVTAGPVVAAWGVNARPDRVNHVMGLSGMDKAMTFGVTKNGSPRHPLYVLGKTPLVPFKWDPQ